MAVKMIIFAACVATTLAQYAAPAYPAHHAEAEHAYAPTPYNFEYSVNDPHTYDVHSQSESSDGNGNVKGTYSLLEADGSTRVVEYTADDHSGFNAEVKKIEGHSQGYKAPYSTPAPAYKPAYSAPAYSAPAHSAPAYSAPAYSAPAYKPAYSAPAYSAPAHSAPAYSAPAHSAPAYSAPAHSAQAYSAPAHSAPAYSAPAHSASAYSTPAYKPAY
uniref:ACYPI009260 protein n=1 Tax=Acyrthosiphon pisum TaxID=7029 RepID=C4WSY0_ACYPI|nr:ACYPI009260 [Acyrthosiphon pisum]